MRVYIITMNTLIWNTHATIGNMNTFSKQRRAGNHKKNSVVIKAGQDNQWKKKKIHTKNIYTLKIQINMYEMYVSLIGISRGVGGLRKNPFHGGGMDIFWSYTIWKQNRSTETATLYMYVVSWGWQHYKRSSKRQALRQENLQEKL